LLGLGEFVGECAPIFGDRLAARLANRGHGRLRCVQMALLNAEFLLLLDQQLERLVIGELRAQLLLHERLADVDARLDGRNDGLELVDGGRGSGVLGFPLRLLTAECGDLSAVLGHLAQQKLTLGGDQCRVSIGGRREVRHAGLERLDVQESLSVARQTHRAIEKLVEREGVQLRQSRLPRKMELEKLLQKIEAAAYGSADLDSEVMKLFPSSPPDVTSSIDAVIQLIEAELPGWWWTCGYCTLSNDASLYVPGSSEFPYATAMMGPDFRSGPEALRLLRDPKWGKLFDDGFHRDRQGGTVPLSMLAVFLHAKIALTKAKIGGRAHGHADAVAS